MVEEVQQREQKRRGCEGSHTNTDDCVGIIPGSFADASQLPTADAWSSTRYVRRTSAGSYSLKLSTNFEPLKVIIVIVRFLNELIGDNEVSLCQLGWATAPYCSNRAAVMDSSPKPEVRASVLICKPFDTVL